METSYLFFDDETANNQQRICAVGYVVGDADHGTSALIDPESNFSPFNTKVHGVSAEDVAGKPNFAEFWSGSGLSDLVESSVFVGHNCAGADLHHIRKSLAAYGIAMPATRFVDTMAMAYGNGLPGSLKDLCAHYGISIGRHHDALSDAMACREVFRRMTADFGVPEPAVWTPSSPQGKESQRRQPAPGSLGFVHGSDQTVEDALEEIEEKGIRGNPEDIESVKGVHFVVTGTVPGFPGDAIEQELNRLGAKTSSSVSGKTQYLVVGHNAGRKKIDPAIERRIPVITVTELLEAIDR